MNLGWLQILVYCPTLNLNSETLIALTKVFVKAINIKLISMSHSASTISLFFIRLQIVSFLIHFTWNVALLLSLLLSVRVHDSNFWLTVETHRKWSKGNQREKNFIREHFFLSFWFLSVMDELFKWYNAYLVGLMMGWVNIFVDTGDIGQNLCFKYFEVNRKSSILKNVSMNSF